jgi:hypothetical protein
VKTALPMDTVFITNAIKNSEAQSPEQMRTMVKSLAKVAQSLR